MKDKRQLLLPVLLMLVLAISMWPGVSRPIARLFAPAAAWLNKEVADAISSGQNFSTAYALAFCAGVFFPPRLRWALPLGMLVIVNILTNLHYGVSPLDRYLIPKILAFAALIWLGTAFKPKSTFFKLLGGGVLGALIFYFITNTFSWIWDPAYAKTFAGWIQSLTIGTPGYPPTINFLLNSLLSGGLFTGLFAGAMKMTAAEDVKEEETDEEPEPEKPDAPLPAPEKSEA